MTRTELFQQIKKKRSYLCVGLDTDLKKIPKHLLDYPDPIFEFNRQIIDATKEFCVAYKPNVAFYEAEGAQGWESLRKTQLHIGKDLFSIADAKRGDIGNTSELYARAFFERMDFDAITVAPYMGRDSITPFMNFKSKWTILLAHTSNEGSQDFQLFGTPENKLYEEVIIRSQQWATPDNMMYVVGATRADKIGEIRALAKEYFFLVPGIGAQGGDLHEVSKFGMNSQCGLLVNSSRSIIYASSGEDFADAARQEARKIASDMGKLLDTFLK